MSPAAASVRRGETRAGTSATGHYSDGSTADLTDQAAWASADPGVAAVDDATGLATGVSTQRGWRHHHGHLGGHGGTAQLQVTPATLEDITCRRRRQASGGGRPSGTPLLGTTATGPPRT